MTDANTLRSVLSDAELILAARSGDGDAYGELYIRHLQSARAAARALARSRSDADDIVAEAFSRVLSVLQRGGGPDISFRPYLLTTIRNTFYERTRRVRLEDPTDEPDDTVNLALLDAAASQDDRAMIATAFASLPERWQLVLWHTEVEGRSAAEVAPLLGIAANAVAALAYRAREGLRQAYLQSHLQQPMADACQNCVSNLGAYVRDSLPARERRKVDEHLETCDSCPALLAELTDANSKLRAVLIPILIGVPAAKFLAGISLGKGVVAVIKRLPRMGQAAVGTAAASTVAALAITAATLAGPNDAPDRVAPADESTISIEVGGEGGRVSTSVVTGGTAGADDESASEAIAADTEITDDTTPSNTLAEETVDSTDIVTLPTDDAFPIVPVQTAPNVTVRTTPTTQPRTPTTDTRSTFQIPATTQKPVTPTTPATTTATTPATSNTTGTTGTTGTTDSTVAPTQPTQATSPPTQPTSPPTQPTTAPTEPTTPPTDSSTTSSTSTTSTTIPPVLAEPQIGAELVGSAYANGPAIVRINAANGTAPTGGANRRRPMAGPATAVQVKVPLPTGVTFGSISDPAWTCSIDSSVPGEPTLVCDIGPLADGASDSADIKLLIGTPAAGSFEITPRISADGGAEVAAANALTVTVLPAISDMMYMDIDRGNVLIIGNGSMSCRGGPGDPACVAARLGEGTLNNQNNNRHRHPIVNVGADEKAGVFNASTAKLDLGTSTVTKAMLVWGGDVELGDATAIDPDRKNQVRFITPDGVAHELLTDDVTTWGADVSYYSAAIDVTSLVRASGDYSVANIQTAEGVEGFGGWSLVVVTHDDAAPLRLLAIAQPDRTVSGPPGATGPYTLTVPLGSARSRAVSVAIASYEGDLALPTDLLTFGAARIANPFDSSVIGAVTPAYVNNFGVDADLFTSTVTAADFVLQASSTSERYQLSLIGLAIDF